jgi:hypothetical protein
MTSPDRFALQHSALNTFLFAEVGTEHNGMTLTALSVIARLGKDPWEEARRLAGLPKASATSTSRRSLPGCRIALGTLPRQPPSPRFSFFCSQ